MSERQLLYFRGRVAQYHILRLLGVGPGDEVLLQAFTCVAVPEAIMATGAKPIWVDLAPGSVNLDPIDLASKITPRTKAIIAQHTFGIPADLDAIIPIAEGAGVPLIEDCCHSFASFHKERPLGSLGVAAFWSYEWGKPVIAGIGGEARFNSSALRARAEASHATEFKQPPSRASAVIAAQYLMHALTYGPRRYWTVRRVFHTLGRARIARSNYNAVGPGVVMARDFGWGICGFSEGRLGSSRAKAGAFLQDRVLQAGRYSAGLRGPRVGLPSVPADSNAVYSRFPAFVPGKKRLLAAAREANLEVAGWFTTPVHPLEGKDLAAVSYAEGSCPRAEEAARTLVSLPLHPKVDRTFQDQLIHLVNAHADA
jgi:dTDP-4-amino-4,6-dideoxygalactose transaminase